MNKKLTLIFFLALLMRMAYIAIVPPRPMTIDDSSQWNNTALHFFRGEGFLTCTEDMDAKRPPLYPLFLAANYRVFGKENFIAVKMTQAFLGALTCCIIFGIGIILFGENVAFYSGMICAVYPPLIVYAEILQSETFYLFLLFSFMFLWYQWNDNLTVKKATINGLVLGMLNLCRGTMLYFPFFIFLLPVFSVKERTKIFKIILLSLISFAVIFPWTWRNYKVYKELVPICYGGAELLWFGTLPWEEQRLFGNAPSFRKAMDEFRQNKGSISIEAYFKKKAVENIIADPLNYLKITAKKFIFFWSQPVGQKLIARRSAALGNFLLIFHILLLVLFIFGIVKSRLFWKKHLMVYALIFYFMILHVGTAPEPRYRLPIEPFMILFAVQAVFCFLKKEEPLS